MPENPKVLAYLSSLPDPQRQADTFELHAMMQRLTGDIGHMWGSAIVGYDRYRRSDAGDGEFYRLSFSPNGNFLTLHFTAGVKDLAPLLKTLGKHQKRSTSVSFRGMALINRGALEALLRAALTQMRARYPV